MEIIETERLIVREFESYDLSIISYIYHDQAVMQYINRGNILSLEETVTVIQEKQEVARKSQLRLGLWVVVTKEGKKVIGSCGIFPAKGVLEQETEISFLLAKEAWGKGYGSEIARAIIEYGMYVLKLPRMIATVHPDNKASIQILKSSGMQLEREVVTERGERLLFSIKITNTNQDG